jgi:putative membrane protein
MRMAFLFAMTALSVATVSLCADEPRPATGDEKFSDAMFVEKATIGGIFEVKASQLVEQRAGNAGVKNFAERVIADHTKANGDLANLAERKGWQSPTSLDKKHQDLLDQLSKTQGDQFDRLYVDTQVKAHDKTVALFQKASQEAQDKDLKAWAMQTLPTLKEHQRMVKQLNSRDAGTATSTTSPARSTPPH